MSKLPEKYQKIMRDVITEKRWKQIVFVAYLDAVGKVKVNGKIVRDAKSTAAGRARAREFFAAYFMGLPVSGERLSKLNKKDQEKEIKNLTDDELRMIVQQAEKVLSNGNGSE